MRLTVLQWNRGSAAKPCQASERLRWTSGVPTGLDGGPVCLVAHMLGDLLDRLSCRTQVLSNLSFLWCSRQSALIQTGHDASKAFHHEVPKSAQFLDIGLLHDELVVFDSHCVARLHYWSARHRCPAVILLCLLPSISPIRGTSIRKRRWSNLRKHSPEIMVGHLLQRDPDILMDRVPVRSHTRSAIP